MNNKVEQYFQSRLAAIKTDLNAVPAVGKKVVYGGAALVGGLGSLMAQVNSSPLSAEAAQLPRTQGVERRYQAEDIQNAIVGQAEKGVWFHPVRVDVATGQPEAWEYTYVLRDADLPNASLADTGVMNEINLVGSGNVGVDFAIDSEFTGELSARGAKPFIRVQAGAGDTVVLMDANNNPINQVAVDGSGYAGIIGNNIDTKAGVRVFRTSGETNPVRVVFGNMSAEDLAKQRTTSEMEIPTQFAPEIVVAEAPVAQPQAEEPQAAPEFLQDLPVYAFAQAPAETRFLAQSSRGEGWSHAVDFTVPQTPGIAYGDKDNVGEMYALARNGAPTFDIYMRINPDYINDFKQGQNNRPAIWLKTKPNAIIQLLDANRSVLMIRGQDGKDYPAQALADSAGFGGIVLPDFSAQVNIRVVLPNPEIPSDTQMQFGPEEPQHRGKASTLDTTLFIPRQ